MNNVLKFEEFIINEGVSRASWGEVCKVLKPFGWDCEHKSDSDGITITKGKYQIGGHLKHNASKDVNRFVDINTLDDIRSFLLDEFNFSYIL